jgi:hypothetical protein
MCCRRCSGSSPRAGQVLAVELPTNEIVTLAWNWVPQKAGPHAEVRR